MRRSSSISKITICWVRPGVLLVRAKDFCPVKCVDGAGFAGVRAAREGHFVARVGAELTQVMCADDVAGRTVRVVFSLRRCHL